MKIINRKSVFFRYMAVYLLVTLIIVGLALPIYRSALQVIDENARKDYEVVLNEGVTRLEKSFESIMSVDYGIKHSSYLLLKQLKDDQFKSKNYMTMLDARDALRGNVSNIELTAEVYLIFQNNSRVISKNAIYTDRDEFFSRYMVYEGLPGEQIVQLILDGGPFSFLPATMINNDYINSYSPVQCLTFIARSSGRSVSVCAIYRVEDLEKSFHLNKLPETACMTITDVNGCLLCGNSDTLETGYTCFSRTVPNVSAKVSVYIPDAFFEEQAAPLRRLMGIYVAVMLGAGALLAVLLALLTYLPLYRLVKLNRRENFPLTGMDEFRYLRRVTQESCTKNADLQRSLDALGKFYRGSVLMNVLLTGSGCAETDEMDLFRHPTRLALIDIGYDVSESEAQSVNDILFSALDIRQLTAVKVTSTQLAVLFEATARETFETAVRDLYGITSHEFSMKLSVTISDVFTGAHSAKRAYAHLQACSMNSDGMLRYIKTSEENGERTAARRTERVRQIALLNTAIRNGNAYTSEQIFKTAVSTLGEEGESLDEIRAFFYALQSVPAMILCETGDERAVSLPVYDDILPASEQFDRLCNLCVELAQGPRKDAEVKSYKEDLVAYINEHFSDPGMYAGHVADRYNISTKQVSRILREFTSYGFADYLDHLRMQKAAELLASSNESVAHIALQCGFNSTNAFYKAYKKAFGTAPSHYRK